MRKGINTLFAKNAKQAYLTGNQALKTILDKEYMDRLFNKMHDKFNSTVDMNQGVTIDFTTGKAKDIRESIIMIGLPYEDRLKENMKPFLKLIWGLEKGEIEPQKINELFNDDGIPEKYGEIYKILTKQNESPQQVVVDNGSSSLRNHERAIAAMVSDSRDGSINN
jgi:ribosomal protein L17